MLRPRIRYGSAVNLADYFLVRCGLYDVASFVTADGACGRFAWRGLLAYTAGLAAEWPFVSQLDYTGPLVRALGGTDISWLVGWFAAVIGTCSRSPLRPAPPALTCRSPGTTGRTREQWPCRRPDGRSRPIRPAPRTNDRGNATAEIRSTRRHLNVVQSRHAR